MHNFWSFSGHPVVFHVQKCCLDLMVQLQPGTVPLNSSQASKQCPPVDKFLNSYDPSACIYSASNFKGGFMCWSLLGILRFDPFTLRSDQKGVSPYNVNWISSSGYEKKEKHQLVNSDRLSTSSEYTKL